MKVVSFFSAIPGLLHINGALAGHNADGPLSVCIPEGRFILSFLPLQAGYLAVHNLIDISGSLGVYDGTISVFLLWDNLINIKLSPVHIELEPQMPYTMSSSDINFGGRILHAVVYFDRRYSFSLEEQGKGIVFATCFEGKLIDCRVAWRTLKGTLFFLAEGWTEQGKEVICVTVGKRVTLEFHEKCNDVKFTEDEIVTLCPVHERCTIQLRRHRKLEGGHAAKPLDEVMIGQGVTFTPHDLIYGARMGAQAVLEKCLSRQLAAQLSTEDLEDFFGDFAKTEEELSNGDIVALSYRISDGVFGVKRFRFEQRDGVIYNIDQLD